MLENAESSITTEFGVEILFLDAQLIELVYPEEIEINLAQAKELDAIIASTTNNEKFSLIINLQNAYGKMSYEAQQYFANEAPTSNQIIASAILVNNLPIRILAKFYIRVFKPKYTARIFSDYDKGKKWLKLKSKLELESEINN